MDEIKKRLEIVKDQIAELDLTKVIYNYDRESDTLMVHFYGLGVPAVSVLVTDDFMLRINRVDDRIVGFQIDHFLSTVVYEIPDLIDVLDIAETHDLTADEIVAIRRKIAHQQRERIINRSMTDVEAFAMVAD
jgi:hypothetical protein